MCIKYMNCLNCGKIGLKKLYLEEKSFKEIKLVIISRLVCLIFFSNN